MKVFRFLARIVLVLLLAGMASSFFESSFLSLAHGPPHVSPRKQVSLDFETDLGVVALEYIHSIVRCVCPAPACAGDLEGDVQGD